MSTEDNAVMRTEKKTTDAPVKHESIFRTKCSYILITEFCERLAFYGIVGSHTHTLNQPCRP